MKKILHPRTLVIAILIGLLATPQLIRASPLPAVDDAQTVVLLHMDGADGSNVFTDESGKVWVAIGDPRITSYSARFNQSLELGSDRSLLSPDTEDVYFANSDFTIDFWVRFEKPVGTGGSVILFSQQQDADNSLIISRSATNWEFKVRSAGVDIVSMSADKALSGVWNHIAVVREFDTFHLFENGKQIGLVTDVDGLPNLAAPIYIGSATAALYGNLDEFRISRTARWTADFTPPAMPYQAPTPTPTNTPTITFTPTATSTPTMTPTPAATPIVIVITVPAIITINDSNTNTNTSSGSGSGSSNGGSFSPVTPMAWAGAAVFGGLSCGGYYIRTRVYVDDNQDKMMSPAEGVTGLQIFILDQTYARLGSMYTIEGKADFCIPVTHYGKMLLIDIPYLQLFGTVQVPEQPNQDLEIWFPGEPPTLPLFLP